MQKNFTDGIKIVAAIAVVGIHSTSPSESEFVRNHTYLSLDFLSVIINQWARFSVPLFIYLSGYGLAKSDKNPAIGIWSQYGILLKRRLPTILVPYLFFSCIALAMEFHNQRVAGAEITFFSGAFLQESFHKLRTGGADYHLYFLVILTQCYIGFPIFLRLARTNALLWQILSTATLLLVPALLYKGGSDFTLTKLGLSHPVWHASFAVYWVPYFMLGVSHAVSAPKAWNPKGTLTIGLLSLLCVLIEYSQYSHLAIPVDYYNHFSRVTVFLYALSVIWFLHSISHDKQFKEGKFAGLAVLTFCVYLIHPQVLRLTTSIFPNLHSFFSFIVVTILSFTIAHALTIFSNRLITIRFPALTIILKTVQRLAGLR